MDTAQLADKKETLVRQIRRLPHQDRRYIIGAAILDLDRDLLKPNGPDRFAILQSIAEQATGNKLTKSRSRGNTEIRMFIATEMQSEGFTQEEIGRWMGRDHSTIAHYTMLLDDARKLPTAFADLLSKYESFIKQLQDYDRRNL